jgi:predicted pyridoxine 5'-phosphate oxidase superfamily flavin-nucleotide-binding protein
MDIDTRDRFHLGELDVQRRAGVSAQAARLAGMLAPAQLDGGPANFLAQREFAVLTARDGSGTLWISPLIGPAGFLDAHGTTLDVRASPVDSDSLSGLPSGQPVGLLAVEFANRRRMRLNGTLIRADAQGLTVEAEQAFGNCPSYIQQRRLEPVAGAMPTARVTETGTLTRAQRALVRGADTFFLGTAHPTHGADASHKGGRPGFVRLDERDLWWPDYAGNNLFNSLGNIAVNPEAALLFIDFTTGATLQLSGAAELEWITPGAPGDDGGTGRRVRFHPHRMVTISPLPIHSADVHPSPRNPALTS